MLIICTNDPVIQHTGASLSANPWDPVVVTAGSQNAANLAMNAALARVNHGPLCFSAHGNDLEIGDADAAGLSWTAAAIAAAMVANVPADYGGPVLIHACAEHVSNFSAGLAVALQHLHAFNGLWIYGYNVAVPSNAGYPPPVGMGERVDLQGTQVVF